MGMGARLRRPSAAEVRALACVLDWMIPPGPDGRLPSGGDPDFAYRVAEAMRSRAALRPLLEDGLAELDERARERGAERFAELPRAEQSEVLGRTGPHRRAFLMALAAQTFLVYYGRPDVLEAHGYDARPPYPEGYEIEPTDFELLEPVRRCSKMYRRH